MASRRPTVSIDNTTTKTGLVDFYSEYLEERKYVELQDMFIFAATFNVNAKIEESLALQDLLNYDETERLKRADLVCFGFQEVVELNTTNVVGSAMFGDIFNERKVKWCDAIMDTLNSKAYDEEKPPYVLLAEEQMVGTLLLVFVSETFKPFLRNVAVNNVPRGVGKVLGNKGGVCVRFDIQDTSVCIVNSHLSANRENVDKRNADFAAIVSSRIFRKPHYKLNVKDNGFNARYTPDPAHNTIEKEINSIQKRIKNGFPDSIASDEFTDAYSEFKDRNRMAPDDHDIVFWMGDLNYRIIG